MRSSGGLVTGQGQVCCLGCWVCTWLSIAWPERGLQGTATSGLCAGNRGSTWRLAVWVHGLVSMEKGIESVQHVQDMLSVIVTDLQGARFEQIGINIHSRRQ